MDGETRRRVRHIAWALIVAGLALAFGLNVAKAAAERDEAAAAYSVSFALDAGYPGTARQSRSEEGRAQRSGDLLGVLALGALVGPPVAGAVALYLAKEPKAPPPP